jgi:hypothetical protein
MENLNKIIEEQKEIEDTEDIQVVMDWLKKYYTLDIEIQEGNPIFYFGDIDFPYFEQEDSIHGRYNLDYRESNYKSVSFDDLVEMGFDSYITSLNLKIKDVYLRDVNYNSEVIIKSSILSDFIDILEEGKSW